MRCGKEAKDVLDDEDKAWRRGETARNQQPRLWNTYVEGVSVHAVWPRTRSVAAKPRSLRPNSNPPTGEIRKKLCAWSPGGKRKRSESDVFGSGRVRHGCKALTWATCGGGPHLLFSLSLSLPLHRAKGGGGGGRAHGVPGGQIVPTSAPSMEGASRSGVPRPLVPLPHRPYATTEALGFFLWCALPPSLAGQGRPLFPFSLSCHRVESRETTTVGLSERATCVLATHTPLSPSNIPAACACPRPSCTATHPIYAHRHPASLLPSTRKPQPQPAMGNTSGSLKPGAGGSTHTHTYVATECV